MTAFAGLLVVVVNAIEIYEFQETPQIYAIRAYAIVFGFMILMAEVNWPRLFLEYFRFLDVWAIKGLFILFVAVLTIDTKVSNDYGTLQLATALAVGLLGFIYLCLGLMCVKSCRDMRKATLSKERERRAAEAAKARARSDAAFATESDDPRRASSSVQSEDSVAEPRAADVARRGERRAGRKIVSEVAVILRGCQRALTSRRRRRSARRGDNRRPARRADGEEAVMFFFAMHLP